MNLENESGNGIGKQRQRQGGTETWMIRHSAVRNRK
jgi:hypothetical protein